MGSQTMCNVAFNGHHVKTLRGLKLCDMRVVSLCVQGNGQCVT
jgi:hypothetical protein